MPKRDTAFNVRCHTLQLYDFRRSVKALTRLRVLRLCGNPMETADRNYRLRLLQVQPRLFEVFLPLATELFYQLEFLTRTNQ